MTPAPPEPKLPHKNPGVEKPDGFFVKKSCNLRKSDNPHFGALVCTGDRQKYHTDGKAEKGISTISTHIVAS